MTFASIRASFLRWGVSILGVIHLWQVFLLSRQLELLRSYSQAVPHEVRLGLAAAWGALWLLMAGLSFWRKTMFDRLVPAAAALYLVYQLVMVWAAESAVARAGWPLTLIWTGLFFLMAASSRLASGRRQV